MRFLLITLFSRFLCLYATTEEFNDLIFPNAAYKAVFRLDGFDLYNAFADMMCAVFKTPILCEKVEEEDETPDPCGPDSDAWGYDTGDSGGGATVSDWPSIAETTCGGSKQSPIALAESSATGDSTLEDFVFTGYTSKTIQASKSGGGPKLKIVGGTPKMSGASLGAEYCFAQFHFHWGRDNNEGSEHTVNDGTSDVKFPVELHLVHYKCSHGSLGAAIGTEEADALAVVGIVLHKTDTAAEKDLALSPFTDIVKSIDDAKNKAEKTYGDLFDLQALLTNLQSATYFRYSGSLTTPGCDEKVTWTVFKEPLKVLSSDLDEFRTAMQDENCLPYNWRPTQTSGTPIPVKIKTTEVIL